MPAKISPLRMTLAASVLCSFYASKKIKKRFNIYLEHAFFEIFFCEHLEPSLLRTGKRNVQNGPFFYVVHLGCYWLCFLGLSHVLLLPYTPSA